MYTRKMYEEVMVQRHGEWADFFMDNSLEHDDDIAVQLIFTTGTISVRERIKHVNFRFNTMEVA